MWWVFLFCFGYDLENSYYFYWTKKSILGIICCQFIESNWTKTILVFGNKNKVPLFDIILFFQIGFITILAFNSSLNYFEIELIFTSKYRVWPPPAISTVRYLRCIEYTYRRITCPGILFHSSSIVLSPVARNSAEGACASLHSNPVTHPKHLQLAKDPEILMASLEYTRSYNLGNLLLFRCPPGILNQNHWFVYMAIQMKRSFFFFIVELSGYRYLQQVVRFPPQTITLPPRICLRPSYSYHQNALHVSSRYRFFSSAIFKLKQDSSLKSTLDQSCNRRLKWCRAQFRREV